MTNIQVCNIDQQAIFVGQTGACGTQLWANYRIEERLSHAQKKSSDIFQLFINLFEARYESLEILAQLEIKKMLLDRLVNLLSRGYVIPVVKYIKGCWENKVSSL